MSGPKFTPRPWTGDQMSMTKKDWATLHQGEPITVVCKGMDVIAAVWAADDQEVANARLILAAPDLFEAADALRPLLTMIADGFWEDCPYHEVNRQRIETLFAALAKALGEDGRA